MFSLMVVSRLDLFFFSIASCALLFSKTSLCADFASCLQAANNHTHISVTGDCFELKQTAPSITYKDAVAMCGPDGHPAFLSTKDVREWALTAAPEGSISFVGLVKPGDNNFQWNWLHPDGRQWEALTDYLDFTWGSGPEPGGGAAEPHAAIVYGAMELADVAANHSGVNGVFCQFQTKTHHFKRVLVGSRPISAVITTVYGVETDIRCAALCHNDLLCGSFTRSPNQADCRLTQLPSTDSDFVATPDSAYVTFDKRPYNATQA